jgi:hypothetical protein
MNLREIRSAAAASWAKHNATTPDEFRYEARLVQDRYIRAASCDVTAPRIITSKIDFGTWVVWQAWDDNMGADCSPIGDGPTEADAIDDLLWMLNAMEAAE